MFRCSQYDKRALTCFQVAFSEAIRKRTSVDVCRLTYFIYIDAQSSLLPGSDSRGKPAAIAMMVDVVEMARI